METIFYILIATFIVSLVSLSGLLFLILNDKLIKNYMIFFVAVAAGALLGNAFFHLIPESFEMHLDMINNSGASHSELFLFPSIFILFGILTFYLIEKFVNWHHHHDIDCHNHSLSKLTLVGDGFHHVIDGVLIAIAFMVNTKVGYLTTFAIILHEFPQKLGDYSILLHSGFSKTKALIWNFLSSLTIIFGGIIAYFMLNGVNNLIPSLTGFTAGGFIYIALADIIPELHSHSKESKTKRKLLVSGFFFFGIIMMYLMVTYFPH